MPDGKISKLKNIEDFFNKNKMAMVFAFILLLVMIVMETSVSAFGFEFGFKNGSDVPCLDRGE